MRRESLLHYYERELRYIRRQSSEFAEKYPDVAERLLLESTRSRDPHVERLIEAFALIAARIHQRLEDDFSEVSDSLLEILYPHFLRPIPSMTICRMEIGPDKDCPGAGLLIERNTPMETKPVDGVRCIFRNAFETRVFPVEIKSTEIAPVTGADLPENARSALKIKIGASPGAELAAFEIPSLRFFLNDQGSSLERLYEIFFREAVGLRIKWNNAAPVYLGGESIRPAGFGVDEGMLDYPPESFVGYRLLQEYFTFPEKFLFVDLDGIARAPRPETPTELEISVLLSTPANAFDMRILPEHLLLNCTPAVNLFDHPADPIRIDHTQSEYKVVPDARSPGAYEVYSIKAVEGHRAGTDVIQRYNPLYALRHGSAGEDKFWHTRRHETIRKDTAGTDVTIQITNSDLAAAQIDADVLRLKLLCTNRDLPTRIPFGDKRGDLNIRGLAEISKITCLRKPTAPRSAPIGPAARWRIISHLALNHLSLGGTDPQDQARALDSLREILKIYDYRDSPSSRQRIAGLVGLKTRPCLRRIPGRGFGRGLEIELEFDREQYTGMGVLLFASVLERFLGLYASVNAFVQVVARIQTHEEILKKWPPRAGEIQLL